MRAKNLLFSILAVFIATALLISAALADDSVMFRRNISKTPEQESEKAGLAMMYFTVPAQAADGTLLLEGIDYEAGEIGEEEGIVVWNTPTAKPLVAVYIDDLPHEEEVIPALPASVAAPASGLSIGRHDTFVAHSLDDGATWKTVNVSRAADLSSFKLANGHDYPGDSYAAVVAVAGNKVMAAWLSRYCDGGSPLYTLAGDDTEYDETLQSTYALPDLYVRDIWGVMGTQKSVDYEEQGFPDVGEIPYGCVWTARGTLIPAVDDNGALTGGHDIAWTKAERLTSGTRDPNRLEVDGVEGAGFVITWQEDPEGLRPGQGLGPGEGWSGAIVNAKTDIWYSYIKWDHFNLVDTDGDQTTVDAATPIEQYTGEELPKPAVPMAMPVRLTDNNMCKAVDNPETTADDYCYADIDFTTGEIGDELNRASFCSATVSWTNPGGATQSLCQAPDGRVFNGRVGASRPRLSLQPYDSDGDDLTDSAWFLMGYEETKALGEYVDEEDDPIEIGKNIWYHTFEMSKPEVVQQGGMLNQPSAFDPETGEAAAAGEFLSLVDEFDNTVYFTEIARRFSFMAQGIKALDPDDDGVYAGTSTFLLYKAGILNQGGPADIFARRIVIPETFDPLVDNPYDYANMACDDWVIEPGTVTSPSEGNPNYIEGLCGAPATNLSATTNDICYTTASVLDSEPSQGCVDDFPWEGSVETDFPKVAEWDQTVDTLDDQSWENPFDVAKGHRGFIDGDFVMVLYAWSPNWKANSVGNDKYNLYVRRSFDGGATWTTTPDDLGGRGVTGSADTDPSLCENFGIGGQDVTQVCYSYQAGEFERARNVSQLVGTKVTILDPRYSPSGGPKKLKTAAYTDDYVNFDYLIEDYDAERDPSKYFLVFETGDNTTAAEGEPTPMDLFYSRATVYGDFYEWEMYDNASVPELRWPWLEKQLEDLSGEAAMTANPSGDFMYVNWNQWREDEYENVWDSDVWFRRVFYNIWTEVAPSVSIVTTIPLSMYDIDEELNLVAFAKDNDRLGEGTEIVEYEWSIDGVVVSVSTSNAYNAPPRTLSKGWHGFSVRAKDHEGHWSNAATINILIADITKVTLPLVLKP
jgi:hypothetical protein